MFQLFKTYLQTFDLFQTRQAPTKGMQITHTDRQVARKPVDLDYKDTQDVMLITEYNDAGEETPIALAFMTKKNEGMVLVYLPDLSELE